MIEEGDTVILGVSGGADLVCMLRVLKEIREQFPMELRVVHIEHGIRRSSI